MLYNSVGIVCFCEINKEWNVLLVNKRNTYNFSLFVRGQYKNSNNALSKLFNGMTIEEKLDIWFCNYDTLFSKLYCVRPCDIETVRFKNKYNSFARSYRSKFGNIPRKTVEKLLVGSKNQNTFWEIPKGRHKDEETDLECAKREFYEETGVNSLNIKICDTDPIIRYHTTNTANYCMKFYTAIYKYRPIRSFETSYFDLHINAEIVNVAWHKVCDVPLLNVNESNRNAITCAFKNIS